MTASAGSNILAFQTGDRILCGAVSAEYDFVAFYTHLVGYITRARTPIPPFHTRSVLGASPKISPQTGVRADFARVSRDTCIEAGAEEEHR